MRSFSLLLIIGIIGTWFWFEHKHTITQPTTFENTTITLPPEEQKPVEEKSIVTPVLPPKSITITFQYSVPFTSQAPTGDWSKSVFQDGCEEASTLMVWMAREKKTLTKEQVKAKLIDMAAFETKLIGHGVDTDMGTTREILLDQYFGITDVQLDVYNVTLEELKLSLQKGLVIVPTNGRALHNPNFTAPGPLEHMLVIKGYDVETKEFITNDPGTRKGESYRYPEQVLYDAIREYPTGKHIPITTERKVMLVIPFEQKS